MPSTPSRKTTEKAERESTDASVRLSVPVTPETHQDFAIHCVDLEVGMGQRLIQLIKADMDGRLELQIPEKPANKSESHTKCVPANLPKALHKEFRKYCLRNRYVMTVHVERLILWDLAQDEVALLEA